MVNVINGKTANELVYNCLEQIIMRGNRSPSRNGDISTIYNAFCTIENPRARHLSLFGRKNKNFKCLNLNFKNEDYSGKYSFYDTFLKYCGILDYLIVADIVENKVQTEYIIFAKHFRK